MVGAENAGMRDIGGRNEMFVRPCVSVSTGLSVRVCGCVWADVGCVGVRVLVNRSLKLRLFNLFLIFLTFSEDLRKQCYLLR